jgi:hypothetical protein
LHLSGSARGRYWPSADSYIALAAFHFRFVRIHLRWRLDDAFYAAIVAATSSLIAARLTPLIHQMGLARIKK